MFKTNQKPSKQWKVHAASTHETETIRISERTTPNKKFNKTGHRHLQYVMLLVISCLITGGSIWSSHLGLVHWWPVLLFWWLWIFQMLHNFNFFVVNYFCMDHCILQSSSHKCSAVLGLGFIKYKNITLDILHCLTYITYTHTVDSIQYSIIMIQPLSLICREVLCHFFCS